MQKLQRVTHETSKKMMGVLLAPDGNAKDQVQMLRTKTTKWAQKIIKSPLDEETVWAALKHAISETVKYPLAATTLTKKECNHVMAPALCVALPRTNIVRTFPRKVLYSPTYMQDLGLMDPYTFTSIVDTYKI